LSNAISFADAIDPVIRSAMAVRHSHVTSPGDAGCSSDQSIADERGGLPVADGRRSLEALTVPTNDAPAAGVSPGHHRSLTGSAHEKARARTEGGEALRADDLMSNDGGADGAALGPRAAYWFALWTHSHCEQLVHDQLVAKGFHAFLPMLSTWSRRTGGRRLIPRPMFPSYLFVRHAIDKSSYLEVAKTRGLVRILGPRWDRLTQVPDAEIEALQRLLTTDLPVLSHPYLHEGQRVLITHGPLEGVEGILVRSRPNRGLLVLSVNILHQSVAVEVDCTTVVPIGSPSAAGAAAASSWRAHVAVPSQLH
jgi:transcription termination/antitermination protein NusG